MVLAQKTHDKSYIDLVDRYDVVKKEVEFLRKNRHSIDRKVEGCVESLELLSVMPYRKNVGNLTLEQCSELWSQMDSDLRDIASAIYRLNNLAKELRKEFNPKKTTKKKNDKR